MGQTFFWLMITYCVRENYGPNILTGSKKFQGQSFKSGKISDQTNFLVKLKFWVKISLGQNSWGDKILLGQNNILLKKIYQISFGQKEFWVENC